MTTYSRTDIIDILDDEFSLIASAAGINPADTPKNYKSIIDNTLLDIGFTRSQLETAVADPQTATAEAKLFAVARYQALKKFASNLSISVDLTVGTPSIAKQRSQMYKQVKELRDEAGKTAAALGGTVSDDFSVSWLQYNFLSSTNKTDEFGS